MIKSQDGTLQLHHFLPYRLFVLASRISDSLAKHYEEQFEISRPEWRVVAVLSEESDLSAAQVAERTAMDKVAVSRAVTKLLASKLIRRQFSENDKRRSVLRLSEEGHELYKQIVPIALDCEQKILDQLSDTELDILDKLLNKLDQINLNF